MIRKDWLLQQFEAIAEAVALMVGKRKETPDEQSIDLLATTSRNLLGIDLDTLTRFGPDQAAALLGAAERCVLAAALLAEDAELRGDPVRAALGVALLRQALASEPQFASLDVDALAGRLESLATSH